VPNNRCGWIAEEALATALFCALSHADDPVSALVRAEYAPDLAFLGRARN
jgi:hypothetical protein